MKNYLMTLLRTGETFCMNIVTTDGTALRRMGVMEIDDVGIVVCDASGTFVLPWSSIDHATVEGN